MKKTLSKVALITILAVFLSFTANTFAETKPETGTLTIYGGNFRHMNGKAIVNLFKKGDDVPGKPFRKGSGKIVDGKIKILFNNLPWGDYAAILFHDENDNNDLDHNVMRFPAEPMGFSNGFKLSLFSGMPSFKKLRFAFDTDTKPLEISVK